MPGKQSVSSTMLLCLPVYGYMWVCLYKGLRPCTRGGYQVSYSNTVHLIPLRQSFTLPWACVLIRLVASKLTSLPSLFLPVPGCQHTWSYLAFYIGAGAPNQEPHVWAARTLYHWTSSEAWHFKGATFEDNAVTLNNCVKWWSDSVEIYTFLD